MKPDWQNKSYAKNGAATGPSTMHPKLKVGMTNLHSKIGAANHNMPQAPKPAKPVVRKLADGGFMGRGGGVMSDEEYQKRVEQGEKNLNALKDIWNKFTGKGGEAKSSNITGESGMSESDIAKKQAMSGGAQMPAAEPEKTRQISDYMAKAPESEAADYGNEGNRTSMATAPTKSKSMPKAQKTETSVKMTGSPDIPSSSETPASKEVARPSPTKKTYRTLGGKIATYEAQPEKPESQRWGVQNVVPNLKSYAGSVSDYIKNFETPAERRSRLAKEGK